MIDEIEMREAVSNVIDNALKYATDSPFDVLVKSQDDGVCIQVSDAGPGMAPDEQAHAFERFYRGQSRGDVDGSGIGLAIVKRAVERARGK